MKNILRKSLALCLSILLILTAIVFPAGASINEELLASYYVVSEKEYTLIGGVTEREIVLNKVGEEHQQYIFVLEVAADNEDVSFVTGYNDGDADEWQMNTVRNQAHALEETRDMEIVASVNGSFFHTGTGEPTGLVIMEGEIVHPTNGYPFFGVTKDGEPVIRKGNGRTDDLVSATPGYCLLVENGKCVASPTGKLAPRTAVGIRDDGTVVICVNDGRQDPYSYGFDNDEMAEIMYALGCNTALNLDGGASSTFLTQREGTDDIELRNQPSNGYERKVAATLHIYTTAKPIGEFDHIVFNEPEYECVLDKSINLDVYAVDANGYKTDFPKGGYLQVEDETYGTVNGTKFTATDVEGTVTVNYILDGEVLASTQITTYDSNIFLELFQTLADLYNTIMHLIERVIEEIGERLFGI